MQEFQDKLFMDVVGQEKPKKELRFYLDAYPRTRMIPNLMIVAPKGQGKTTIAKEIAKGLYQFDEDGNVEFQPSKKDAKILVPKKKPFVEINCSTLTTVKQFINSVIVKYANDKDVTLFFDEASEIPPDVTMALLTILNPNPDNRTTFSLDEYVCDFDFRRQSFIFATSEIQKVFHALTDRLERITLQDYTMTELSQIVQKGMGDVKAEDGVLMDVASVLRGNARGAQKMAVKIKSYLQDRTHFTKADWQSLKDTLSIAPLGLNLIEISILRYLEANPNGTSLTSLSAKTGMSREALRQDSELYLQKHGLMEITTLGRQITASGQKYLKDLPPNFAAR
jgi:Holliday junction resolvasome RuvABC ATP-dependent DNA helicase subunit